jgi:hypothetical protein
VNRRNIEESREQGVERKRLDEPEEYDTSLRIIS